jgi:hypothetical protein
MFRATPAGRRALEAAKQKVRELFRELIEDKWASSRRVRGPLLVSPGLSLLGPIPFQAR